MRTPGVNAEMTDKELDDLRGALNAIGFSWTRVKKAGDDGAWEVLVTRQADVELRKACRAGLTSQVVSGMEA